MKLLTSKVLHPKESHRIWTHRLGQECSKWKCTKLRSPFRKSNDLLTQNQVEGEAQGDEDSVQKLLQDLNRGPSAAQVDKIEHSEVDTQADEKSFDVK